MALQNPTNLFLPPVYNSLYSVLKQFSETIFTSQLLAKFYGINGSPRQKEQENTFVCIAL